MRLNRKFTLYKVEDRVPFNPFIYLIIDPAWFLGARSSGSSTAYATLYKKSSKNKTLKKNAIAGLQRKQLVIPIINAQRMLIQRYNGR